MRCFLKASSVVGTIALSLLACTQAAPSSVPPPGQPATVLPAPSVAVEDGKKPENPAACAHGDNPTCATHIDPKVAAEHGPEVQIAGEKYGAGVTLPTSTAISALMAQPDAFAGKRVRIEGEIEDVCHMRGCWFSVKSDKPGQTMKFKVMDGVMTFPVSAMGKYAVAEGQIRKMPLTLEQTRKAMEHEALEQGKPFDPASVTEPMTIVRLDGLGAVIRDKK